MTRSERLLTLLDLLRNRSQAITAESLSEKLAISVCTVYRDIESLRQQGADIRGEAGMGYLLFHDFLLPPLMFSEYEIESLVLGIRWVARNGDTELASQAHSALTKINAVLPDKLAKKILENALYPINHIAPPDDETLITIRQALREERRLSIDYEDKQGNISQRTVYPINVGYFENLRVIAAWCELRKDFRHFRTDRIRHLIIGAPYNPSRQSLEKQWQANEGITLQEFNF